MNNRKQHVINTAHQLFIDKGFQSTSIQDILDLSGISKGTFYNYFSSKNELLIAIFKGTYDNIVRNRTELLIGQDRSNIDIFIRQVELQMKTNRENRLISLFEEVNSLNDTELKHYIETQRIRNISWLYERFIDIFGEDKKPYLLDCAIMFMGILRENIKFYQMAHHANRNLSIAIRFSIKRLEKMVESLVVSGDQLIHPEFLDIWLPNNKNCGQAFQKKFQQIIIKIKKDLQNHIESDKYTELLDFIRDEIIDSKVPRKFLIESTLFSIKSADLVEKQDLQNLEFLIDEFLQNNKTS